MKHSLEFDGVPVRQAGCCDGAPGHPLNRPEFQRMDGHGLCECGDLSPHLPSTAARRRWHKAHKEEGPTDNPAVLLSCLIDGCGNEFGGATLDYALAKLDVHLTSSHDVDRERSLDLLATSAANADRTSREVIR